MSFFGNGIRRYFLDVIHLPSIDFMNSEQYWFSPEKSWFCLWAFVEKIDSAPKTPISSDRAVSIAGAEHYIFVQKLRWDITFNSCSKYSFFAGLILVICTVFRSNSKLYDMDSQGNINFSENVFLKVFKKASEVILKVSNSCFFEPK